MTRFETILARLCAQSGAAYLHIDCPPGRAPRELADIIGADNLAILDEEQEVQIIVPGAPGPAGRDAREKFVMIVATMTRDEVEGANALCIVGSGAITRWSNGESHTERLPGDVRDEAFRQRDANAQTSAV